MRVVAFKRANLKLAVWKSNLVWWIPPNFFTLHLQNQAFLIVGEGVTPPRVRFWDADFRPLEGGHLFGRYLQCKIKENGLKKKRGSLIRTLVSGLSPRVSYLDTCTLQAAGHLLGGGFTYRNDVMFFFLALETFKFTILKSYPYVCSILPFAIDPTMPLWNFDYPPPPQSTDHPPGR